MPTHLLCAPLFALGVCSCGPSLNPALKAYSLAIDDVANAGQEDIDRCENADASADRMAFCNRAKRDFDIVKASAHTLAGQDGGAAGQSK